MNHGVRAGQRVLCLAEIREVDHQALAGRALVATDSPR